jgi:hypothetical protein
MTMKNEITPKAMPKEACIHGDIISEAEIIVSPEYVGSFVGACDGPWAEASATSVASVSATERLNIASSWSHDNARATISTDSFEPLYDREE